MAGSLVMFMLSKTFTLLLISRILQGVSGTGIWTIGLALLADCVPEERLALAMGNAMIGLSVGSFAGWVVILAFEAQQLTQQTIMCPFRPPLGGVLYHRLGYYAPWIFSIAIVSFMYNQDGLPVNALMLYTSGGCRRNYAAHHCRAQICPQVARTRRASRTGARQCRHGSYRYSSYSLTSSRIPKPVIQHARYHFNANIIRCGDIHRWGSRWSVNAQIERCRCERRPKRHITCS